GDTVRTSDGASINLALIPGAFVQLTGNSEIKIEDLTVTKDGNETAGGVLDRRASIRLNRGKIVGLFSHSDRSASEFNVTTAQVTLSPDSDCLFSAWTDGTGSRIACGRGEVKVFTDAQSPEKIVAGYFSQWPTASKVPIAAITNASAQTDIKTALDVELELLDQAAGWQHRRVF
ncbi:MAG TPA: FecR domain-containing protein, partial [Candidatus Udaeobacter sp.]|nr:FecR domain-containing protein [Candidatus Udaeobacter sp.]